jgi:hypothetical protein
LAGFEKYPAGWICGPIMTSFAHIWGYSTPSQI